MIPQALMAREVGHRGLTELHVVQTMHERKKMMAERAEAFVALPGGIGTLEELYEMWIVAASSATTTSRSALLNVDGYYDALLEFMRTSHRRGFVSAAQHRALIVGDDVSRLMRRLRAAAQKAMAPDDYSQT